MELKKYRERTEKKLADWELEKGIKIKTKNSDRVKGISERSFMQLIRERNIVVKTEKGIEYLESRKLIGEKR